MRVSFDPAKDILNQRKHGRSLSRAEDFDFDAAYITADTREDHGEQRFRAISFIGERLFTLVFADDEGSALRAISLRKATKQEGHEYVGTG